MDSYVRIIADECEKRGIIGKKAKIGTHLTLFPTFWATEKEARRDAALLKLGHHQFNVSHDVVTIEGIGFFSPPPGSKNDALHLRIKLDPTYRDLIIRLKASDLFDWVTPPAQTAPVDPIYLPHVHVIEAEGLRERVAPLREKLDLIVKDKLVELYPLELFVKNESDQGPPWKKIIL